jgi:predicted nucleotidyltransferase
VLIGSQANNTATAMSDWDIAIRWESQLSHQEKLEHAELLKQIIADATSSKKDQIDLIDVANIRLAMRAVIAEEGVVLYGEDSLAWHHFLTVTWGELEEHYWRKQHAA